jgi:mRNA interferase MazF
LPIFEPFAVVRVPFPFTDRAVQRRRPAVVLSDPEFQRGSVHVLLTMITTASRSCWPLDWPIQDLADAGLNQVCYVGTTEKAKSTAAQLVSAIEIR